MALLQSGYFCIPVPGQSWQKAYSAGVNVGIKEFLKLGRIDINARSCARLSCWDNADIYFCNDVSSSSSLSKI